MASTRYTLSGKLRGQVGLSAPGVKILGAFLISNVPVDEALVDYDTGAIQLGALKLEVTSTGVFLQAGLLATNSEDISHEDLAYAVVVRYVDPIDRNERTWTSPWFELTGDVDLQDIVQKTAAPAVGVSQLMYDLAAMVAGGEATISGLVTAAAAQVAALLADGQALLDQQESLAAIDTTDAAVAYASRYGATAPAAVARAVASGPGTPTVQSDGSVSLNISTPWGVRPNGTTYYDANGATAGEEAVLTYTATGPTLIKIGA